MNHVLVTIVGTQKDVYGTENRIEMVVVGRHYQKNGVNYITYQDAENGLEGVNTLLKIQGDSVTLVRSGIIEQKQDFSLQQTSSSVYETPYGSMTLTVLTKSLDISFGPASGVVDIGYELMVDGQWQSANTLHIKMCADNNMGSALN